MILNDADNIMVGDSQVDKIYCGSTEIWAVDPIKIITNQTFTVSGYLFKPVSQLPTDFPDWTAQAIENFKNWFYPIYGNCLCFWVPTASFECAVFTQVPLGSSPTAGGWTLYETMRFEGDGYTPAWFINNAGYINNQGNFSNQLASPLFREKYAINQVTYYQYAYDASIGNFKVENAHFI
jgi:hypothetical protein